MSDIVRYIPWGIGVLVGLVLLWAIYKALGIRVIRSDQIGVVEKWWSTKGSLEGSIIALAGEAGLQPEILRGGVHLRTGLMYKVSYYPFVTVTEGTIGYIFAREGKPVDVGQSYAKTMDLACYQDVRKFLADGGQAGPQRAIIRPGTYAFNLAQFVIITGSRVYYHPVGDNEDMAAIKAMQTTIKSREGFTPVIVSGAEDRCGIVTIHDGPSLISEETGRNIICPTVGDNPDEPNYHNNFQDPEKFLLAGGFRGRQLQVISEGTYWINRLFADVELVGKTTISVGFCGVVVSYVGEQGADLSGEEFQHGELVTRGSRGVWAEALQPGKYAINPYAYHVEMVPTTNVILKWQTNATGDHKFDVGLSEVGIITKDAFEPNLPLSVVVHIDYRKAPQVIQRFGDVKRLVEQTLDPMVSAYFKNIGQTKTLIELLQERGAIQVSATLDMKGKFSHYNLELEEVLMDTPRAPEGDVKIQDILEQLRDRQIAKEQVTTYKDQRMAADEDKNLKEARAVAEQQTLLTQSKIKIEVQSNEGAADLARAKQDADKIKITAGANAEQVRVAAQADADKVRMMGEAQADATTRNGIAEGIAISEQVAAFGGRPDLKLASDVIPKVAAAIGEGGIQLVPRTLIQMGGEEGASVDGSALLATIVSGRAMGIDFTSSEEVIPPRDRSPEVRARREEMIDSAKKDSEPTGPDSSMTPETDVDETSVEADVVAEETSPGNAPGSRKPRSSKKSSDQ